MTLWVSVWDDVHPHLQGSSNSGAFGDMDVIYELDGLPSFDVAAFHHRSTPAAVRLRVAAALFWVLMSVAGCGPSTITPLPVPAPIAAKTDVIITYDAGGHACVVALRGEALGSTIPCNDVVPFLRDELRVPSGSSYDLRTVSDVDRAEKTRLGANLKAAGYRFIRGPDVSAPYAMQALDIRAVAIGYPDWR